MDDEGVGFGPLLRELRERAGWSLADLAAQILFDRRYISKVEHGERLPERPFAEAAAEAFGADGGDLLAAWEADDAARRERAATGRLLVTSTRESLSMLAALEETVNLTDLDDATRALAVEYLASPAGPMLHRAVELRSEANRRLRAGDYRPSERADLLLILGRLCGVLAYAALDLDDAAAAMVHASTGHAAAARAGDGELAAWMRGTQALIARFGEDYHRAQRLVMDGLRHHPRGTARVRLLCGLAQARANLGDGERARTVLDWAGLERDLIDQPDSLDGLFTFSHTKQHYYAASSLIWLDDDTAAAERAVEEATTAVRMWETGPAEDRSLDDEALARVYRATAHVHLGNVEAAGESLRPVLDLPDAAQISWIRKRTARIAELLDADRFHGSRDAADLAEELRTA